MAESLSVKDQIIVKKNENLVRIVIFQYQPKHERTSLDQQQKCLIESISDKRLYINTVPLMKFILYVVMAHLRFL